MVIAVLLLIVCAIMQWLALRNTCALQKEGLWVSPPFWFIIGYLSFVFIPHGLIYLSPVTRSYYADFVQGETFTTVFSAAIFGICYAVPLLIRLNRPHPRLHAKRLLDAVVMQRGKAVCCVVLLGCGVISHFYLHGLAPTVSTEIIKSTLTGNFASIFENYNDLRYAAEKEALLERGARGVGTVTNISEFCIYSAFAFFALRLVRRRSSLPAKGMLALLFGLCLYVALATGARAKIVYLGIYTIAFYFITRPERNWKFPFFGLMGALGLVILITFITPKANVGSGVVSSLVNRFSGNAVNDAAIIESQVSGTYKFSSSSSLFDSNFVPIDLQLTYLFTGDEALTWYESPTALALFFIRGGLLSVALNGLLTGLILAISNHIIYSSSRHALLKVIAIPLLSIFYFSMPISSWFSPASIVSVMFVLFISFLAAKFASAGSESSPDFGVGPLRQPS
jgi:hypothetical protein